MPHWQREIAPRIQAARLTTGAIAAAGGESGPEGPEKNRASSTIRSDPQRPHLFRAEVETISQLGQ
ncbi:MAG: hypothetical protein RB191_18950 [Terriglobia bacterium]|nr:hypothetical protein [Terriglobia bacterium]